jgi:hypothetical protein
LDGHGGFEKFDVVDEVDPVAAASVRRAHEIRGGDGCRHS